MRTHHVFPCLLIDVQVGLRDFSDASYMVHVKVRHYYLLNIRCSETSQLQLFGQSILWSYVKPKKVAHEESGNSVRPKVRVGEHPFILPCVKQHQPILMFQYINVDGKRHPTARHENPPIRRHTASADMLNMSLRRSCSDHGHRFYRCWFSSHKHPSWSHMSF